METINTKRNYPTGARFRFFQAAVLSLSLLLASVTVGGCLLGDLAAEFTDAPAWLIQSFVSFPIIGNMIANLVGGIFASKVGKKNLCLIGVALATIGGFFPMFIPSLTGKIICRVAAGFGCGLIQPLSASLIIDCFEGPVASTMMGIMSSCVGLGASLFSYTMTAIMVYDWHFAYCAHLYGVAIFFIVLFGIPAFVNDIGREDKKTAGNESADKHKLPKTCYIGAIGQFFFALGYAAFDNCTSLAAVETGVITTVQAAALVSFGGLVALVGGLLFGFVQRKMGYNIGWFALVLVIIGFVIVGCTSTISLWYVGVVFFKLGFCWWMAYANFLVNDGTDETNSALATSLCFIGNSFGNFIFAYVFAFIGTLAGGISQHHGFLYGCVWIAVALVLVAVNHFKNYKHYQELA